MQEILLQPHSITKHRLPLLMLVSATVLRLSQPSYASTTATTDGLNSSNTIQLPNNPLEQPDGSPTASLLGPETALVVDSIRHQIDNSEPSFQLSEVETPSLVRLNFAQGQTTTEVTGATPTDVQFSTSGTVGLALENNLNTSYSLSMIHTVSSAEIPTPKTGTLSFNFGGTFYANPLSDEEKLVLPPDRESVDKTFEFIGLVYQNDTLIWTGPLQQISETYNINGGLGIGRQFFDWQGSLDDITLQFGDTFTVKLSIDNLTDPRSMIILGGSSTTASGDRNPVEITFQENVPEPTSLALSAGALLAFMRRKRS